MKVVHENLRLTRVLLNNFSPRIPPAQMIKIHMDKLADVDSPRAWDRQFHVHGQTNARLHQQDSPTAMVTRGQGVRIETDDGQSIIDGFFGLGCVSLGNHDDRLARAAMDQMQELPFAPTFCGRSHPRAADLARALTSKAAVL
ncbi:hypothetical protein [Ruegeria sp. HKCCD6428]|uniref:hypothetical protein n=1 Tax=Ruegeria sp. HKCCD6428 TaxID=2683002 RepID=UPI001491C5F8|nr:hypothetical protein [Ruegeria sp. HKCCD6428]